MTDTIAKPSPLSWDPITPKPVAGRAMVWFSQGRNNDKPVWKLIHGDYRARVNIGFEAGGKWSGVVNEVHGKMHFNTADDAKAWCERYILDSIIGRLRNARKALSLYSFYQDNPTAGIDPEHPEYLEFEVVQNYGTEFQEKMVGNFPTTRMADAWINGNGLRNAEGIEIVGLREDGTLSEKL